MTIDRALPSVPMRKLAECAADAVIAFHKGDLVRVGELIEKVGVDDLRAFCWVWVVIAHRHLEEAAVLSGETVERYLDRIARGIL